MAKASLRAQDGQEGIVGFGEGWGLVVSAKSAIHQFDASKRTGEQTAASCKVILELQHCDANGKSDGSDTIIEYLNACNPDKQTGDIATHPGKAKSRDDANPKDMGTEIGTEGNCLYGPSPYKSCKLLTFTASLEARGFRADILNEGYFPDWEGMVAYFVTEKRAKINTASEREPTQLLVKEIKVYPYEKGTTKPATNAKNGTAKPAAKETAADPSELAMEIMQTTIGKYPGAKVPITSMKNKTFAAFSANSSDKSVKDAAKAMVIDPEWWVENADNLGCEVDDESVQFPS